MSDERTGRVPPHDLAAERAVIGGVLLLNDVFDRLGAIGLKPENFYRDAHALIYEALSTLLAAGVPADSVTLRERLVHANTLQRIGGDEYLGALTDTIPTVANIEAHAKIVIEKHALRKAIWALHSGAAAGYAGNLEDAQEAARQVLDIKATEQIRIVGLRTMIETAANHGRIGTGAAKGIYTGWKIIDDALPAPLGGGEIVVFGGRPSCGKSHMMLGTALHTAGAGHPTGVLSCEDPEHRIGTRGAVALEPGLTARQLGRAQLNFEQRERIERAQAKGDRLPFYYSDCHGKGLPRVLTAMKALADLGCISLVLDHLHAIPIELRKGETVASATNAAMLALTNLARSLRLTLFLGSHLGRGEKSHRNAEPTMQDLRESSQIEGSAEVIVLTWKPSDAEHAPIYGKVAKLKDEPARPRFQLLFAENGALKDLIQYTPPKEDDEPRGWGSGRGGK